MDTPGSQMLFVVIGQAVQRGRASFGTDTLEFESHVGTC